MVERPLKENMVLALVISLVLNVGLGYLLYRKIDVVKNFEDALANATTAIKSLTARAVAAEQALAARVEADKNAVIGKLGDIKKVL